MKMELTMDLPPSVNSLWRIGSNRKLYRSPDYQVWRKAVMWQLSVQAKFNQVDVPYKLTIRAVRPDKRKRDLDNIIKALSDILESSGIIKNDSLAQHIDIAWVEEGPPCWIEIQTMDEIHG